MLAENEEGYRNLVKITSEASLHGFYYKPRVSKKFLAEHSQGTDWTFRMPEGRSRGAADGRELRCGAKCGGDLRDLFGKENFFLEIQDQGLEMEHRIHPGLFQLEKGPRPCRWWRPMTATISAKTTRMRRM